MPPFNDTYKDVNFGFAFSKGQAHNIKPRLSPICNTMEPDQEEHVQTVGVKAAISMLKFYKSEYLSLM